MKNSILSVLVCFSVPVFGGWHVSNIGDSGRILFQDGTESSVVEESIAFYDSIEFDGPLVDAERTQCFVHCYGCNRLLNDTPLSETKAQVLVVEHGELMRGTHWMTVLCRDK